MQRLTRKSVGVFNSQEWVKEGDGLLASSRLTRRVWQERRTAMGTPPHGDRSLAWSGVSINWNELIGLPRASMLTLGYAAEMYLKAAIVKAYWGCSQEMLDRDLRQRFGHDLKAMAKDVEFPTQQEDVQDLKTLQKMILADARYPVEADEPKGFAAKTNKRTSYIWSDGNFTKLLDLVQRLKAHAQKIDSDHRNPAMHTALNIVVDGYLSFRIGGHLSPRITYRPSSEMKATGSWTVDDLKRLLDGNVPGQHAVLGYWAQARIFCDGWTDKGRPKTFIVKKGRSISA